MLKRLWLVAWVGVGMLGAGCGARAQSGESACSLGFSGGSVYGGGVAGGKAAYTLMVKSSHEQQLLDGSYVRSFSRTRQARASDGRTMQQMSQRCTRGEDGQPHLSYFVTVYDPKTRTTLGWTVGNPVMPKEARLTHMPEPVRREPAKKLTPAEEERRKAMLSLDTTRRESKTEDLGTRTIAGIEAHGTRMVRTVPVGEEGNELPIVLTSETWTAKEMGIVLLGIHDDPRSGKYTYEVEEITMGEPDAALFAPPEGYVIKEERPVREVGVVAASVGGQP